jgi:hypothetical protein
MPLACGVRLRVLRRLPGSRKSHRWGAGWRNLGQRCQRVSRERPARCESRELRHAGVILPRKWRRMELSQGILTCGMRVSSLGARARWEVREHTDAQNM